MEGDPCEVGFLGGWVWEGVDDDGGEEWDVGDDGGFVEVWDGEEVGEDEGKFGAEEGGGGVFF